VFDNFSYTTVDPRQAWNLRPENGATWQDIHTTLTWNAGDDAIRHLVYFSEDEDAVVNRTVDPIILPVETTELYVGPLDLGQTYYWCVDEEYNPVFPGEVFSLTAEEYRLIDDFESYDIPPEPLPEQIMIPGELLVEAQEPPDQEWIDPVLLVEAIPPPDQVLNPEVVLDDGAVIVTDPERGQVLALDGDGDYVHCGNPAARNFGAGDGSGST
jgi:hypothetical protein